MSWLSIITDPLNQVLFTIGNDNVTWAELLGFLTGGACVWLTVRAHIANFGVGIANCALFLVLFASAHLWADAALQIVFIVLGVVGWWQWLRGGTGRTELPPGTASVRTIVLLLAAVAAATVALTWVLRQAEDSAPFWDALTTSLSLAAQWLLNARKLQTWWFWIAADVIYIPLYVVKRLDLTALVYVLFLGMCIAGLHAWQRDIRAVAAAPTVTAAVAQR